MYRINSRIKREMATLEEERKKRGEESHSGSHFRKSLPADYPTLRWTLL